MSTSSESTSAADDQLRKDDDVALRRLGIRRELRKEFTSFSTLSFALGILGYLFALTHLGVLLHFNMLQVFSQYRIHTKHASSSGRSCQCNLGMVVGLIWMSCDRSIRRWCVHSLSYSVFMTCLLRNLELVSAYPTVGTRRSSFQDRNCSHDIQAGGVYTSTAFVVPTRYRASVTFLNAW